MENNEVLQLSQEEITETLTLDYTEYLLQANNSLNQINNKISLIFVLIMLIFIFDFFYSRKYKG